METGRWLRPVVRRVVYSTAIALACLWLGMTGLTACTFVWWPDHGILDNTPAEWFGGMAMLSLVFAAPSVLSWLSDRQVSWR